MSNNKFEKPLKKSSLQPSLFPRILPPPLQVAGPEISCDIFAVEKRRDGGTRYWCRAHRADATAKGGVAATVCRHADKVLLRSDEILTLDMDLYRGGIALWGAVPPVYDTTRLPIDSGIHIHARPTTDSKKEVDFTYRAVRLVGKKLPPDGIYVHETEAIYYMISSVFGFPMSYVPCTHCGWPHLDKDWFSVFPHRRHLCSGCGRHFHDKVRGIGNPIIGIREALGVAEHGVKPAAEKLKLKQSDYPGGIQVWGSNPAFLWTQPKHEEEGIHIHAFKTENQEEPDIDDTYSNVVIDGILLDPHMVRTQMAQKVMPSLKGRVKSMHCPNCGISQFDVGEAAYTPSPIHTCTECKQQFPSTGRMRNIIANPLPGILEELSKRAPRMPQNHQLNLMPEIL